MKRSVLIFVIGLTISVINPVIGQQLRIGLEDLSRQSDMVLQVRAESMESRWVYGAEGKNIVTTTHFRVIDCIRGNLGKNQAFTLDIPGGTVGDTTQYVSSSVAFARGEESILFLQGGGVAVTGGIQGKYPVSAGNVYIESRPVTVSRFTDALRTADSNPVALSTLLSEIRPVPMKVSESTSGSRLKSGNSTTTTYAVSAIKSSFVGTSDTDGDGYWDAYSFSILINGDVVPGPENVYMRINCTTTGQSWTATNPVSLQGTVVDYLNFVFDNTRFTGITANVELEFTVDMLDATRTNILASDNTVTGDVIKVGPVGATALTINSITPDNQSAGTGSQVTIYGSGFGATQGTGKVEFFYQNTQPKISAPVTSWSDTQIVCTVPTGLVNSYPAAAASGAVTVTSSSGRISNGFNYRVSFAYGGSRWSGSTVSYRINENLSSVTGEGQNIQNAANSWNAGNANFKFQYGGTTTNTTAANNGNNDIVWGTIATAGVIGQATVWSTGSTIIETDIVFNNSLSWNTSGGIDIESIALHELGHWLNLRDLYGSYGDGVSDESKALYGFYYTGQIRRNPTADDYAGMIWIYGMAQSVSISGYVKTAGGVAVSSVTMSGFPQSTVTDGNGFYSGDVPTGWSGVITPVKAGYTFNLPSHSYSNQSSSLINQDFTATQANNDATLSDLKVNGTTVTGFAPATLTYDVALAKGTVVVPTVTATTADANATKVITPAASLPGSTTVVVTAQDGNTKKTYTVNFTVAKNNDATLSDLKVNGTTVAGFSKTTMNYPVVLPVGTTVVPQVTATTSDANATRVITQAPALPGNASVVVTAEDGTTRLTYTVSFTVEQASSDATLSDLKVSGTTVAGFNAATLAYQVVLPYGTAAVPAVTATATHAAAIAAVTPAASLPGTTSVVVTAQDGTTKKTYTVSFTVAKNNDATLSDLKVTGTTVAGFVKTTLSYVVALPFGTTVVPAVTATTTDANATRIITPAASLPGSTTVTVTAENGSTVQTYTVSFTLEAPSTDATLADLKVNGTTLSGFVASELNYNIELPAGTVSVPALTATAASATATLVITNSAALPGTSTVQVTAQDGTTRKTYSVNFSVAKNNDASLSDIKAGGTTIPGFNRNTLAYTVMLPFGTSAVPVVTANVNDPRATRVITPALSLPGVTTIVVTAENGVTSQTYTVQFNLEAGSAEASLSDLRVDGVTVSGFNPLVMSYAVILPYGTATLPVVTAVTTNANATRLINQAIALPGQASVVVTAQDGVTRKTYTIAFTVARDNNATLSDLRVDGTTIFGFSANTLAYTVILPYGTTTVPTVSATAGHSTASVTVSQAPALPGTAIAHVVAEDGITSQNYLVNFVLLPPSTDASLAGIQINGIPIPGFSKNGLSYTIVLPAGDTVPPVIHAISSNARATVTITLPATYPGIAIIRVTAEDGITFSIYQLLISYASNGIDDQAYLRKLKVYPNPNNGSFTFGYESPGMNPIRVSILDVTGRVVFDRQYEHGGLPLEEQIQIGDRQQGSYFIRVIDGMNVTYRKFIVE